MFHLITGGSGSGKSRYAEQQVMELSEDGRIYIATMIPYGKEGERRVQRHRTMRAEKKFETIERYTGLGTLELPAGSTVLLECVSNLAANEMYDPSGAGEDTVQAVVDGILHILDQCVHLVVVTNEVFSDGVTYDPSTMQYLAYLGEINQRLARAADRVTEVVYGIPVRLK